MVEGFQHLESKVLLLTILAGSQIYSESTRFARESLYASLGITTRNKENINFLSKLKLTL